MTGFWYLGQPYSSVPDREAAWLLARRVTAKLVKRGLNVFSPILHSHPLVAEGTDGDHAFWIDFVDRPFMEAAQGLIVLTAAGWDQSKGLAAEIAYFRAAHKPILEYAPEDNEDAEGPIAARMGVPIIRQDRDACVWNTLYSMPRAQSVIVPAGEDTEPSRGIYLPADSEPEPVPSPNGPGSNP